MPEELKSESLERRIPLEGCVNFRDLGGYPTSDGHTVKWRRLFRSDAPNTLTEADVQTITGTLGVSAVVDLRNSDGKIGRNARRRHIAVAGGACKPTRSGVEGA